MATHIGEIAEPVPCISPDTKSQEVDKIFSENHQLQGIVVIEQGIPIGLITKIQFYQKIGTLYGYHLYMGRPIPLLGPKKPLIAHYYDSITEVSKLAMSRKEEKLYDYVVIIQDHKFVEIVRIQRLLMKLVEIQVEIASYLNPLRGFPGNHIIEAKLKEIIGKEPFSILYFDLDHFKEYNDTYGFKRGDDLLKSTAELLKRIIVQNGVFLGHIGGDDFIAILNHYHYQFSFEKIIEEYGKMITSFYSPVHLLQQYVVTDNRLGVLEEVSLVSLSIAVATNEAQQFNSIEELAEFAAVVKKRCKKVKGSCYYVNDSH
ncbi:diguanylate cyclase (GGDEF)-like protein [Bacillus thermophilus]|uniref:Diguanylate cyclase (GGDEF)-like protein n=1 Tax=Siminovitchia thermophila TaxID=1245522 RepID=A0ABS2R2G5_9BACI|nr:GGDEF domain-containing protein [Siminovitchia thermophila]MBM7713344.1 diguanylate cyclase (GGDEF)-like protein [Siminovitchia thermophila]ONK24629.1 hypothetical protein BLX87_04495 [Bacillus sp. VT-16-64]